MTNMPVVTAQMHEHALKIARYSGRELYTDPEKLVDGIFRVYRAYDFNYPVLGYDVYNIEAEALGVPLEFNSGGSPMPARTGPLVKDKADLRAVRLKKNLGDQGRFGYVITAVEKYMEKTGLSPPLQFTAPFSLAARLWGIENLLISMITDPSTVHEIMKRVTWDVLVPWVRYQRERFPSLKPVFGADALSSPPNLDVSMLKEFVVPWIGVLKEACGSEVGVVNWWGDSFLEDPQWLFDLKREVSPDNSMIQVQDPDLARIDPGMAVGYAFRHRLKLTFGLGAGFLSTASPEEISERTRKYVSAYFSSDGNGSGFTFYLCNLGVDTPPENIKAAIKAARECAAVYGRPRRDEGVDKP